MLRRKGKLHSRRVWRNLGVRLLDQSRYFIIATRWQRTGGRERKVRTGREGKLRTGRAAERVRHTAAAAPRSPHAMFTRQKSERLANRRGVRIFLAGKSQRPA
jgi:hypothetical protein